MFSQIKTSKENKEVVTQLTNKFNLGAENLISRIALTYSLSSGKKLNIMNIKNSSGKEYSCKVLFGDYINYYIGLVATHYGLHITDKDVSKYVKMHIDEGLTLLSKEVESNSNIDGFQFLKEKIGASLSIIP
jgi:DNA sulfur modification protein DndE